MTFLPPTSPMEKSTVHLKRLRRCLEWQGILSHGEAVCCIYDFRRGSNWSGEAVNHYGGTRKLIEDAIRNRHVVRRLNGGTIL